MLGFRILLLGHANHPERRVLAETGTGILGGVQVSNDVSEGASWLVDGHCRGRFGDLLFNDLLGSEELVIDL